VRQNGFKKRAEVFGSVTHLGVCHAGLGIGVEDGKLNVLIPRIEVDKQVIDFIDDRFDARIAAVDLVDDQDDGRFFSRVFFTTKRVCGSGPSLASTSSKAPSTRLRLRSTSPPKSACPGVSTMLILTSRYQTAVFFGHDGNAPLPLKGHGIHHPLGDLLVFPEGAALFQHAVKKGCLAVVYVRDDGDIAKVLFSHDCHVLWEDRVFLPGCGYIQKKCSNVNLSMDKHYFPSHEIETWPL